MRKIIWTLGVLLIFTGVAWAIGYSGRGTLGVDPATNASVGMAFEHHKIHTGDSFTLHYAVTTASTDDHRTCIGFTAPNTMRRAHATIVITASDPAEFFLYEAPTFTAQQGTDLPIYNRHRNSTRASTLLNLDTVAEAGMASSYTEGETVNLNPGALVHLYHVILAGGGGPKAVGGSGRGENEWILDQGVTYLLMMQNIGANANTHLIQMNFYEHTNL